MLPPGPPPWTLMDRRVSERPQGRVRALVRATGAALLGSFLAAVLISARYPSHASMPRWLSVLMGLTFVVSFGMSAVTALSQLWCWVTPRVRATLTASSTALTVWRSWGQRVIPLDRVTSGWTLRTPGRTEVELELRGGDLLSVEVADDAEADALLDAANVAPDERALTLSLGSPAMRLGLALGTLLPAAVAASMVSLAVSSLLHLPSETLGFLLFALTTLGVALSVWLLGPPTVRVGRDGVSVRRVMGSGFVPWSRVATVSEQGSTLALHTLDGGLYTVSAWGTPAARRHALLLRMREAQASAHARSERSSRLAALDRNGLTLDAWRAVLDAIPDARDDYRRAGLTRDELLAALDDPQSPGDRRVAAAYVLSKLDRDAAGARVRVAVENVAQEPVRVALARAAEGTLDEQALSACEPTRARFG